MLGRLGEQQPLHYAVAFAGFSPRAMGLEAAHGGYIYSAWNCMEAYKQLSTCKVRTRLRFTCIRIGEMEFSTLQAL